MTAVQRLVLDVTVAHLGGGGGRVRVRLRVRARLRVEVRVRVREVRREGWWDGGRKEGEGEERATGER